MNLVISSAKKKNLNFTVLLNAANFFQMDVLIETLVRIIAKKYAKEKLSVICQEIYCSANFAEKNDINSCLNVPYELAMKIFYNIMYFRLFFDRSNVNLPYVTEFFFTEPIYLAKFKNSLEFDYFVFLYLIENNTISFKDLYRNNNILFIAYDVDLRAD